MITAKGLSRYKQIIVKTNEHKEILFSSMISSCFSNKSNVGDTVVKLKGTSKVLIINTKSDTAFCEAYYMGD